MSSLVAGRGPRVNRSPPPATSNPSMNHEVLDLARIEPGNGDEAALRVDADVRRRFDAGDRPGQLASADDVDRAIRPARHRDPAVSEQLDAVVRPRAGADHGRILRAIG